MFFSRLVLPVLSLAASVYSYANPGACTGDCVVHDPAVIRRASDGLYFRFSTGNKIVIATATSISGPWTNKGSVLPGGSKINLPGNQDLWAPDVTQVGNTYYLYYSVSTFGNQNSAIGVATSTTLDVGSWTDHGSTGVTSSTGSIYNAIDGNLVALSGGGYQLNFGSFWGDIHQVSMSTPLVKAGNSAAVQIALDPAGTRPVEGAYMFFRGGYYYLFYSWGICCGLDTKRPAAGQEYRIKVCRSQSPTGGFVDKTGKSCTSGGGTVVLESHDRVYAPGGQ
jgi:arabinan endo-1,5-alpha-L-arabinosidase